MIQIHDMIPSHLKSILVNSNDFLIHLSTYKQTLI